MLLWRMYCLQKLRLTLDIYKTFAKCEEVAGLQSQTSKHSGPLKTFTNTVRGNYINNHLAMWT